eukprot:TRINITY_DN2588_c0_g2_i1.p1 TRINITY_DN2588_c0_g2~~TRINITY_DN2588_c0_g2_i1.p1  ORF type:complete len:638 (-),score=102.37 TRINITY_DN2588_c0_g2_i1:164-2077(-)
MMESSDQLPLARPPPRPVTQAPPPFTRQSIPMSPVSSSGSRNPLYEYNETSPRLDEEQGAKPVDGQSPLDRFRAFVAQQRIQWIVCGICSVFIFIIFVLVAVIVSKSGDPNVIIVPSPVPSPYIPPTAYIAPAQAIAVLRNTFVNGAYTGVAATVVFSNQTSSSGLTQVSGSNIVGLAANTAHGFHIHQYGDLSAADASKCGDHYNPNAVAHGLPDNPTRHVGDMGNINMGDTAAYYAVDNAFLKLQGAQSIIGRAVVIHENRDTGAQPWGNAGSRYAMAVIGIANVPGNAAAAGPDAQKATCQMHSTSLTALNIQGTVTLTTEGDVTRIQANITGLKPNTLMGWHIHEFGDMSAADGSSAGGHYNPFNISHGIPDNPIRHAGDLGNLNTDVYGSANYDAVNSLVQLSGVTSVIGRAIVIHENFDDGRQPTGSGGARFAVCVIGIADAVISPASPAVNAPAPPAVAVVKLQQTTLSGVPSGVTASVQFVNNTDGTVQVISTNAAGLAVNTAHGFHVHQYGDLSLADGTAAGGHYNPFGVVHALPDNPVRHLGDMGNLEMGDSSAWYQRPNAMLQLGGAQSIIGRAVIIHELRDTGAQPTGAAGSRYSMGVIGIANVASNAAVRTHFSTVYRCFSVCF